MTQFQANIRVGLDLSEVDAKIASTVERLAVLGKQHGEVTSALTSGAFTSGFTTPSLGAFQGIQASLDRAIAQTTNDLKYFTSARASRIDQGNETGAYDKRQAAEFTRIQAANQEYLDSSAELSIAQRLLAANTRITLNNRLLGNDAEAQEVLANEAQVKVQQQVLAAQARLAEISAIEVRGREDFVAILAESKSSQQILDAEIRSETARRSALSEELATAQAEEIRSKAELAAATQRQILLQSEAAGAQGLSTLPQLKAAEAYDKQILTLEQQVETKRLLLEGDQQSIKLQAESNVLQAEINAIRKEEEVTLAAQRGVILPGQKSEESSSGSSGLLGGGLAGLAKFALGAAAFVGISAGVSDILKEAAALQTQLSILKVQLEQTDRAGDFPVLRAGLFDIAKDTGVATSQLAALAVQITGTFQGSSGTRGTPQFALDQVKSAAELQKVFGLSAADITQSATALAYTFDTTFQAIGDKAAGLQARFGVSAKELIGSISQIAPVAQQMGLSFNQLALISASAERETGRTGVSVTEALGRVLPNIAQHTEDVLAAYSDNAKLAGSYDKIVSAIASGKTGQVLLQLIQDWSKFSQVQKDALLVNLGGGRQAPQLAAAFGDPQLLKELNNPVNDTGKLNQQFQKLQETISQVFSQLKQSLLQVGIALADAGVLPALKDIADVLQLLTRLIQPLVGALGTLKGALNIGGVDVLSKLIEAVVLLKGAQLGSGLFQAGRAGGPGGTSGTGGGLLNLLSFGLFSRGGAPAAGAAEAAGPVSEGLIASTRNYGTGFFGAFIQRVNNFARDPAALATAGVGIGAVAAGAAVGGEAGKNLTAVGSGLAIGAATGSPLLGVVVGGAQIIENFLNSANEAAAKTKELEQKYSKLSDEKLQKIASTGRSGGREVNAGGIQGLAGSYLNTLSFGLTDIQVGDSEAETAAKELQNRQKEKLNRYLQNIQASTLDPKLASEIQKELGKNDDFDTLSAYVIALFRKINHGVVQGVDLAKVFRDSGSKTKTDLNKALASGDANELDAASTSALDKSKADYQSGVLSGQTYVKSLEKTRDGILDVVRKSGDVNKKTATDLAKYNAEIANYYSDATKSNLDTLRSLRQAQGINIDQTDIDTEVAALKSKNFTDPSKRAQVVNQILADLRTVLQREVDGAKTAAEKLAIEQRGIDIPLDVKIAALQPLVDTALKASNLNLKKLAAVVEASSGENIQQFESEIVAVAENFGVTIYQATKAVLENLLNNASQELEALTLTVLTSHKWNNAIKKQLQSLAAAVTGFSEQLNKLGAEVGSPLDFTLPGVDAVHLGNDAQLQQQANDELAAELRAQATARADILKATVERDPVAAALADINAANVQYANATKVSEQLEAVAAQIRAQHEYEDALNAIYKAQIDVVAAQVASNPVAVAYVQLAQANLAARTAQGQAAQLEAQAQQITAQKALAQAIFDSMQSAVDLIKAVANFNGDAVGAAQVNLTELRSQLSFLISQGAGDAAINHARADIVNAEGALRDAQLKSREDTIDFNLQTKAISTAQAISQYQALLDNANLLQLTTQERRDLILKIQQLKGDLQKDLQFDLPTDLALPTLYEARRLSQSGGNYQDNRQIQITLSSTDPASTEAAVQQIVDAVNAPSVLSGSGRIY